jgi:tetratricopeptide (TPR) repeat protein
VQLGAVIGRTFEPRAIPAVDATLAPDAVERAVEDLLDRDLVRPASLGAVTFRHILIREIAYNTLPRAERARLHGGAGRWLAGVSETSGRSDELAELVAFHLREEITLLALVGESVPPAQTEAAVEWLRRAAESAAAGSATVEAARHYNAAIDLAPKELQPWLYERLGQIWSGGDQGAEAFEKAWEIVTDLRLGEEHELRLLGQALTVRARWTGSVGRRIGEEEMGRRYARVEALLGTGVSGVDRLQGELALAFRPMRRNLNDEVELAEAAIWADRAIASARELGVPDLLSAAYDAGGAVAMGRDQMPEVLRFALERHTIEDRLSTSERADAWIVHTWSEMLNGDLVEAVDAAERARAGLMSGQASSFVLGATSWKVLALHALGRWDEALAEAARAERAWQESELEAPWYAVNCFMAAFSIARSRNDPVSAAHWRELLVRMDERSDADIRTRRLIAYVQDDPAELARQVLDDFRIWTGRFDYVYMALSLVADRRHPVGPELLGRILDYTDGRGLGIVAAAALRARGIETRSRDDLEAALAEFQRMAAKPLVARVETELGLLVDDQAMLDRGLDGLEATGDVEQAARVAGERRAGVGAPGAS